MTKLAYKRLLRSKQRARQSRTTDRLTLKVFWQAAISDKRLALISLLYPLGIICTYTLAPLFISKSLAALVTPGMNSSRYLPHFIVVAMVGAIANRVGFTRTNALQAISINKLQRRAFAALLQRSVGFHNNNVGGKLVSDATDFPIAYLQLTSAVLTELVPFVIMMVGGSLVVLLGSWQLGLLVIAMSAFIIVWAVFNSQRRKPLRRRRLAASKAVTGHQADSIVNIQTVKTFASEQRELHHHDQLSHKLMQIRLRDWQSAARQGNNRIIALLVVQGVFVMLSISLIRGRPELLGTGIFAFSFIVMLTSRLFQVDGIVRQIEDALIQAAPMTEILQVTPEIQDQPQAKPLRVSQGAIDLQDVHFRYRDNQAAQDVFAALNLKIKPGEKIGLVGPSGGGKSTLTRLLLRFDDLDQGAIYIDGQNIATVTQASLRENIAYVPQEPLLFHRSVHENIAYSQPTANHKMVLAAAKAAHADEFISDLPAKYDTIVGERGVKLSGGQRQRIAIARAILKDAPILILDEATSALDSESEVLIQDALWQLMSSRTTLVIAHRLSTIQKMDRIIVLDKGQIVEQGTHKDLLSHGGIYAKLWSHQSGGFITE